MISTLDTTAGFVVRGTGNALARERTSVTAPSYGSVHGTGLPFAGMTRTTAPTAAVQLAAVAGSPPRGAPV